MKKTVMMKFMLACMLCVLVSPAFATYLVGIKGGKGERLLTGNGPDGYHCQYHTWKLCALASEGGEVTPDDIPFTLFSTSSPTTVRVVFGSPWGSNFGVTYNVQLPSAVASYYGWVNAYFAPGTYPVVVNSTYPNGYADVTIMP